MGSNSASGGGGEGPANRYKTPAPPKKKISFKPLVATLVEGFKSQKRAADQNMLDYEGEAAGVTRRRTNYDAMRERAERDRREGGGGNQVVTAPAQTMAVATAPTTAEVSQSAAADTTSLEDDTLYRKRKTKRAGRSLTILTSSSGASDGLTLGKRSLLGS